MATYSYFWRVKSSKSLLQASLHRLSDLLTLVSYNKAKQPSGIKKVSGGCFFEYWILLKKPNKYMYRAARK
jgi:hypothetical protein